jgi:nickel-dependent lactate racemase
MPVTIYHPKTTSDIEESEQDILNRALETPIKSKSLEEHIRPGYKILLIVDDNSRPTPIYKMLPPLVGRLEKIGIQDDQISILIALGTHRPMRQDEFVQKLGDSIASRFKVFNHEWNNPEALHNYGTAIDGSQVILNKAMKKADFIIGLGSITPHPAAGFTGGGKIIVPGVATDHAAGTFHWDSVQISQKDVLGLRDNPMRDKIDEIARIAGLSFIFNVILDGHGRICGAVAGDVVEAHREGARISSEIYGVPIQDPYDSDIYIVDTYPMDQDLWQAAKALCCLDVFVPDDKVIILVSGAEEGVTTTHPEVLQYGYQTLANIKPMVDSGTLGKIVGHYLVQGGRLIRRTKPFLVTPTVPDAEAKRLGFIAGYSNPQDALDAAIKIKGANAKLMILSSGGEICPIPLPNSN